MNDTHDPAHAFVRCAAQALALQGPVYRLRARTTAESFEVSGLHEVFLDKTYIEYPQPLDDGIDEQPQPLAIADGSARTVICLDALAYVFHVRELVDELVRVLAPGGVLLVSAPLDSPLGGFADDYWRLTPACLMRLLEPLSLRVIGALGREDYPHLVVGMGIKGPVSPEAQRGVSSFVRQYENWLEATAATNWMNEAGDWIRRVILRRELRRSRRYAGRFVIDLPAPDDSWYTTPVVGKLGGSRLDC